MLCRENYADNRFTFCRIEFHRMSAVTSGQIANDQLELGFGPNRFLRAGHHPWCPLRPSGFEQRAGESLRFAFRLLFVGVLELCAFRDTGGHERRGGVRAGTEALNDTRVGYRLQALAAAGFGELRQEGRAHVATRVLCTVSAARKQSINCASVTLRP